jgi:hypothetical protein
MAEMIASGMGVSVGNNTKISVELDPEQTKQWWAGRMKEIRDVHEISGPLEIDRSTDVAAFRMKAASKTAEVTTKNGLRLLVEWAGVAYLNSEGVANSSFQILDVMAPPEARQHWLEHREVTIDANAEAELLVLGPRLVERES